jgi:hypothetical protein
MSELAEKLTSSERPVLAQSRRSAKRPAPDDFRHPGCRLRVAQRGVQSLCTYGAQRLPLGAQGLFLVDLSILLFWSTVFTAGQ